MEEPIVIEGRRTAGPARRAMVAAAACAALSGCATLTTTAPPPLATAQATTSTAALPIVKVPWQLTPASTASEAQGERTVVVDDPTFGKVKGTPVAVAGLRKAVAPFTGPTPQEKACEATFGRQAKALGAYSVQVATAGPVERLGHGARAQRVFFRIIYQKPDLLEVRQAAMRCETDSSGRLIAATPV